MGRAGCLLLLAWPGCDAADPQAVPAPVPTVTAAPPPIAELAAPTLREYSGTVVARLVAGDYTYLEIAVADARRWAVTTGAGAAVGDAVRAQVFGTRVDFESPRLRRRFAQLDFASVEAI